MDCIYISKYEIRFYLVEQERKMDDMLANVVSFLLNSRLFEFRTFLSEIHIQD